MADVEDKDSHKSTEYLNTLVIKKGNLLAAIGRDFEIKKLSIEERIRRQDSVEICTVGKMGSVVKRLGNLKERSGTIQNKAYLSRIYKV